VPPALFPVPAPTLTAGLLPILLFPLLGAIANGLGATLLGPRYPARAARGVAIGAMLLATVAAALAVVELAGLPVEGRLLLDRRWPIFEATLAPVVADFALALDPLSGVLVLVITIVGTLIHVYAAGYMAEDRAQARFFALLNLFASSMLLLVLGDSFVLLFFGWEGVGLCSYLLIGFWYHDVDKAAAGKKAFLCNRVGDWGFLVGLFFLFWGLGGEWSSRVEQLRYAPRPEAPEVAAAGDAGAIKQGPTLSFRELRAQLAMVDDQGWPAVAARLGQQTIWGVPLLLVIGLCLFLGVAGKSAQIPLYVWLPDAMAGPTPVSALIHAATMVTAGVYLLARLDFLFAFATEAMTAVALLAAATALLAALFATFENDLKKILAYSTISQLGFMVAAAACGATWVAIFHVVTHACFKACLFLAAGSVLHATEAAHLSNPQDVRQMGGLHAALPRTRRAYLFGCVALAGFPIAAGFYSKDEILWHVFAQKNLLVPGAVLFGLLLATAALTAFYAFRSYYLVFRARAAPSTLAAAAHEPGPAMSVVLAVLEALSIASGALFGWPAAWGGHPFLERWLAPVALGPPLVAFGHGPWYLPLLVQAGGLLAAAAGWAAARALYRNLAVTGPRLEAWRLRWPRLHRAFERKLWVDEAYRFQFVIPAEDFARGAAWGDRHLVDAFVTVIARAARGLASFGGWLDRALVDGAVNGVAAVVLRSGRAAQRLQTGRIQHYVGGLATGAVALVILAWVLG
jgi:NADH-quinone oxidoreductase subunit L